MSDLSVSNYYEINQPAGQPLKPSNFM